MKNIDAILNDPSVEITNIFSNGTYFGKKGVQFNIKRGRNGLYCLGKVRGRAAGTKPQDSVNNVYVGSLIEVLEKISDIDTRGPAHYVWLNAKECDQRGIRSQFSPESVTIEYKLGNELRTTSI